MSLTVVDPSNAPSFTQQPQSQSVKAAQPVQFSAMVVGMPVPTLQWQRSIDGANTWHAVVNGGSISGAGTASLQIGAATISMTGQRYRLNAVNSAGGATSQAALLTVEPVDIPLSWTGSAAITYGQALGGGQLNANSGGVPGDLVYTPPPGTVLPAGSHSLLVAFTPTDTNTYSATNRMVQLTVNRAPLTIRANDQSRPFGQSNPVFTIGYAGFVNGDSTNALVSPATPSTTATASSPLGSYPILLGGGSADNYTITRINGTLTVSYTHLTLPTKRIV